MAPGSPLSRCCAAVLITSEHLVYIDLDGAYACCEVGVDLCGDVSGIDVIFGELHTVPFFSLRRHYEVYRHPPIPIAPLSPRTVTLIA